MIAATACRRRRWHPGHVQPHEFGRGGSSEHSGGQGGDAAV